MEIARARQGLTPAVMTGYCEALKRKPACVIKMDSDGEHDPSDFPKLIENIRENKSNYEWLREDKFGLGKGFRILQPNALSQIMPALEEHTCRVYQNHPDDPENRRGIDRETDNLMDALNKKTDT